MVSTYPDLWYLRHDDIFHDSDKGPKHVEMFWTKCQPKNWDVNHRKKVRTKCQPLVGILSGLFSVVGILSVPIFGWHFVLNISTCFGPLSESWKMSLCLKYQRSGSVDTMGPSGWFDEFWWCHMCPFISDPDFSCKRTGPPEVQGVQ